MYFVGSFDREDTKGTLSSMQSSVKDMQESKVSVGFGMEWHDQMHTGNSLLLSLGDL